MSICENCKKPFKADECHPNQRFCIKKCCDAYRYKANPQKVAARVAKWRKANPEKRRAIKRRYYAKYYGANREKIIGKAAKRYKANLEKMRARRKERYANNRKKELAQVAKWQRDNPDKRRAAGSRWRKNNPEKSLIRNTIFASIKKHGKIFPSTSFGAKFIAAKRAVLNTVLLLKQQTMKGKGNVKQKGTKSLTRRKGNQNSR